MIRAVILSHLRLSLPTPFCLFSLFNFIKTHTKWFFIGFLIILTTFIFLTIFPEITLPPVIYYLVDELLIPLIVSQLIWGAECYSDLLLWIVSVTPPFPDVFGWIDLLFSLTFQKKVTHFICYTLPSLSDLWNYFLLTHDFICSFVEALLLLYISVKVFLTWTTIYVWPFITTLVFWYKRHFFGKDPIIDYISTEGLLFFRWLLLYQTYVSQFKLTSIPLPKNHFYSFSSRRWSSLWLGLSLRLSWSGTSIPKTQPNNLVFFFQDNRLMALKFLIFVSCHNKLNLFTISTTTCNDNISLVITASPNILKELKIHPRDLKTLETDNFLLFSIRDFLVCYLLKLKF